MSQDSVTLAQEQFQQLLRQISHVNIKDGNFSKCSSRFNGSKNSDVNAFIDAIETYKECTKVSDVNALRGLSMLLDDFAATWWQGVKDTVDTWAKAIDLLRLTFGPKKPPYKIYRELFANEQDAKTSSDVFICQARALLSQLPVDTLKESVQIDMIYGLLQRRLREKIPREKVKTFSDLLKECRLIEETFVERFENKTSDLNDTKRIKCAYCKLYGHSKDACRKLTSKDKDKKQVDSTEKKQVTSASLNEKESNCRMFWLRKTRFY